MQNVAEFRENKVLAALPQEILDRLLPEMKQVVLPPFEILSDFDDSVTQLFFPHRNTAISTLCRTDEDVQGEVALTGCEGIVGLSAIFGAASYPYRHLVQVPGAATAIGLQSCMEEFRRGTRFQQLLLHAAQHFMVQISQTALCNRLHSDEERLSRWLLLSHDRAEIDQLPLPTALLAKMLGRTSSRVSITAAILQQAGFITYNGSEMRILDREALERVACSCYWVVKRQEQTAFPA